MTDKKKDAPETEAPEAETPEADGGKTSKRNATGYRLNIDVIFELTVGERGAAAKAEEAAFDFRDQITALVEKAGGTLVSEPKMDFGQARL